ncbi:Tripartite ATP-independent periplasmic transporter, DctQ component [Moorella glycerini]|uniref:2,3-diketo-L-gulonate TRAP transporter small permease protein YiaM n=1 Tax=Neomoorella stamsii TaxID=1266720 RepID=A0A9X7P4W6_9FIRM|nr:MULTISPECIES: TRAP transporter small permease [Moorella]PRR68862.1 2,3-diketo-L-gulonate TRAP transporter small permease protein YiaM [Moorella stamsii]CEP67483.1 Tripartite ATP-independent periplasmic transporter, DctQ component [Moorella glycerini]
MDALKKITDKISTFLEIVEVWGMVCGVIFVASMWIINVIARQLDRSIFFVEELSQIMMILITFIGSAYGVRRARHIRMSAVFDAARPVIQKVLIIFTACMGALITFQMTGYAYDYVMVAKSRAQLTPALQIPYWLIWSIIPIGFFLMGVEYVRTVIKNIVVKEVWLSPEQKSEYEE